MRNTSAASAAACSGESCSSSNILIMWATYCSRIFLLRSSSSVRPDSPGSSQQTGSFRLSHGSLQCESALDRVRAATLSFEVEFQCFGHHSREPLLASVGGQFEDARAMFRLHLNGGPHTSSVTCMHMHIMGMPRFSGERFRDCCQFLQETID